MCLCVCGWVGGRERAQAHASLLDTPQVHCPQPRWLSPRAGGSDGGPVLEAARRGFARLPRFPSICTHTAPPLPGTGCLLGRLAAGGASRWLVKLSLSLSEQVQDLHPGSGPPPPPPCQPPAAAQSQRLHPPLSGLRPSLPPSPPSSPWTFWPLPGPIGASIQLAGRRLWPPVCLSALPYPTPAPRGPRQRPPQPTHRTPPWLLRQPTLPKADLTALTHTQTRTPTSNGDQQ